MSHIYNAENQYNDQQQEISDKIIWLFTPLMNNEFAEVEEFSNQEDMDSEEKQRVEEELEYLNSWERVLEII
ncbi:hypothetical protein QCD85_09335 [Paenibacillus sp. PsM32]|uniref:Uncharacterized protein n=1 Tax=Paenibacillus kyungheensis TaxID=1452732 RepID=A0AAX3LX59_9BACL|nr:MULTISPECIES: hypothetical protein [Paenibacillus]MDN4618298.1 hypothetical protein [Paenibacillus sp. PsM32]MDQ1234319.1 hypothetical protein [Paenibacillus sp. SORGH_AS_0306]MDR6111365.1 hypothetical protein [Paenibacillus sp. SORGH_AS_0338]WCT53931.1 hypothetical protein PQ456_11990 [Paenibacillus kyungheensis]WDF53057.1 hypothetical protein PQ460_11765 [Paenibacillus sp. KACC 21273]